MLAAAQASGCLLSVVAQNRFKTPVMKLKQVLDAGLLGRVLHAQVDSFWWRGGNYYDLWWRGTWDKEGGGCTMNHAVHHIDLFQWMMGLPTELLAVNANLNHENSEVEDFSTAVLTYPDGSIGQITASLVHHGEEQQLVFQGERAKVGLPWQVSAMKQQENGFPGGRRRHAGARSKPATISCPPSSTKGTTARSPTSSAPSSGTSRCWSTAHRADARWNWSAPSTSPGIWEARSPCRLTPDDPFYTREGILRTARHFHEKTRSVENFADNEITFGRDYR